MEIAGADALNFQEDVDARSSKLLSVPDAI